MKLGQTSAIDLTSKVLVSVVGFAANLYLARELGATTLGTYFLVVSVLYWATLFGDLGVNGAVQKRLSEPGGAAGIVVAGIIIKAVLFTGVALVLTLGATLVNAYVGSHVAGWLAALVFVQLATSFISAMLNGEHKVHVSSLLAPFDRLIRSVVQIVLVMLGAGLTGLFFGYVAGGILAVLAGMYFVGVRFHPPSWDDVRSLISFAKYAWLGSVTARAFVSMDTVILGAFVTNDLIGVYEISWNLASLFAIFGGSISQALFPELSSIESDELDRLRDLASAGIAYSGLFLIPGLVGAALVGDVVLSLYGVEFTRGYGILLILVFARLLYAYEMQAISVLSAMDRPDISFRVNGLFLATNLVLNLVLVSQYGWYGAAVATTASAAVGLVVGFSALRRLVGVPLPLGEILRQVVAAAAMGSVVLVIRLWLGTDFVIILPLIFLGAGSYLAILFGISSQFRKTVLDNMPTSFG